MEPSRKPLNVLVKSVGNNVIVNLKRPGYRVKERKWARSKIGSNHRVSAVEAREFIEKKFGVSME